MGNIIRCPERKYSSFNFFVDFFFFLTLFLGSKQTEYFWLGGEAGRFVWPVVYVVLTTMGTGLTGNIRKRITYLTEGKVRSD